MILIYTGNGKGKTSACVGQAIRALGQGLQVVFVQFMKRDNQAGEQKQLAALLGDDFYAGGKGFFRNEADRQAQEAAAKSTLHWATKRAATGLDMLIMDEALYALKAGLLIREDLEGVIGLAAQNNFHLVLSGRGAPDWLINAADLVTEMAEVKHPGKSGGKAQKGIEF